MIRKFSASNHQPKSKSAFAGAEPETDAEFKNAMTNQRPSDESYEFMARAR